MPPKAKKKAAPKKKAAKSIKTEKRNFTFPTHTDPRRAVPGHEPYLDDVMRHDGETARAKGEGREPDYDNAGAVQGTPLLLTDLVKSNVPGDWDVEPDVELPVSVEEGKEETSEHPYERQSITVDVKNA